MLKVSPLLAKRHIRSVLIKNKRKLISQQFNFTASHFKNIRGTVGILSKDRVFLDGFFRDYKNSHILLKT
ncbi:hypothetical protein BWD12_03940 [Leptospira santarosai serovar Bananal]|nr:hypothetical protein BWD11_08220 [Leptospira santarosai serovar Grippotyphosa]ONF80525.1 hypothetical protein BWD12_03940 [Leptospira santarosai serovar Bananal]